MVTIAPDASSAKTRSSDGLSCRNQTRIEWGMASAPRTRRITPEAGRGLEMLGHAIEYLADEFALDCMDAELRNRRRPVSQLGLPQQDTMPGVHPRIEAIELLKTMNREIYFACPEVPATRDRLRQFLGFFTHRVLRIQEK